MSEGLVTLGVAVTLCLTLLIWTWMTQRHLRLDRQRQDLHRQAVLALQPADGVAVQRCDRGHVLPVGSTWCVLCHHE